MLQIPWWQYALLAVADVEGNFLVVSAYKYTSISSAMLLDCFTIPVVMLLSSIVLHAKVCSHTLYSITTSLPQLTCSSDVLYTVRPCALYRRRLLSGWHQCVGHF
jgi:hypothetical protein